LWFQKENENTLLTDTKRKHRKDKATLEISFHDPQVFPEQFSTFFLKTMQFRNLRLVVPKREGKQSSN